MARSANCARCSPDALDPSTLVQPTAGMHCWSKKPQTGQPIEPFPETAPNGIMWHRKDRKRGRTGSLSSVHFNLNRFILGNSRYFLETRRTYRRWLCPMQSATEDHGEPSGTKARSRNMVMWVRRWARLRWSRAAQHKENRALGYRRGRHRRDRGYQPRRPAEWAT